MDKKNCGPKLNNMLKMGLATVGANFLRKRLPLNVMLSVTNRCTSGCSYCGITKRRQNELTTAAIFSLIDQVSAMGCQRLGIWGGEPLVRDDIGEIINYAKSRRLFVTLDSNGYLIPQKLKMLSGLDHLILALDGAQEAHDLNREAGSFQKTMSAIDAAIGKIPLWTITVLTKNNIDSVSFVLGQARKYGFLATFQILHHNEMLSRNQESLFASADSYRKCIKELIKEKEKGAPIASSLNYLRHLLNWPDYRISAYPRRINRLSCWAGKLYCNVDTDGSVYSCSLLVDKARALNFLDVGFKTAFNSLSQNACAGCLASCFTEYNYLYSLDIAAITHWLVSMHRTKKYLCRSLGQ